MAKSIMIQGTMSNAGKSLLAAGLCRIFKQDGYKVAPFKSQNMALNSSITSDGLEMGRAQVVQAEAAGVAPDVRMNPILLKPTSDQGSQVIVNGEVPGQHARRASTLSTRRSLIPDILAAYNSSLAAGVRHHRHRGGGIARPRSTSKKDDIVNMGHGETWQTAPVLLCRGHRPGRGVRRPLRHGDASGAEEEQALHQGHRLSTNSGAT